MKNILFTLIVFFAFGMAGEAQSALELTNGAYEKKQVVTVEGVDAGKLYVRALEVLSDWAGSQSKSKIGIDVQDKDEGMVVYKGRLEIGFHKVNFMAGWEIYGDFTIKIKCKDGKAQITCIVPTATFEWSVPQYPAIETVSLGELIPEYNYKGKMRIKKAAKNFGPQIPGKFDNVVAMLATKMTQQPDNDF
jgi:hypothetical protein